ncbi:hypothetical protein [Leeuwenhoekiella marinoflava]|uniref:hypothetical protein n=1 Tax=Leeuwenhoekiella marinoflava TaxID=988 RepID=UPI003001AA6C
MEAYISFFFESVQMEALCDSGSKGCFLVNSVVELAPVDSEIATIAYAIMHDTEEALFKVIETGQEKGVFTKNILRVHLRVLFSIHSMVCE